jgi:RNA polymerase sigma-70 factor (ECF subfamily)
VRAIWEENRRWVAAVILAYKPRWTDLEDVLQDVAAALARNEQLLRDPGAVRSWLRTVAINASRLAGRKGKLRQHASLDEASPDRTEPAACGNPPEAVLGRQEDAVRIVELAIRLPEAYREPLLLKAVRGLSYRQIGQILGLPETTIETRIARGRRMLKELAVGAHLASDDGASGLD